MIRVSDVACMHKVYMRLFISILCQNAKFYRKAGLPTRRLSSENKPAKEAAVFILQWDDELMMQNPTIS